MLPSQPPPQRSRSPSIAFEAVSVAALCAVALSFLVIRTRGGIDLTGLAMIGGSFLAFLAIVHLAVRLLAR